MQSELQQLRAALEEERAARKRAELLLEKCTNDLNLISRDFGDVKQNIQKEIERKTADLESIALFAVQYPEPLIRINYEGETLVKNISATDLSSFEFNNKTYNQFNFWKLVAAVVRRKRKEWSIEVCSNGILYSFLCRPYPKNNYINIYGKNITKERQDQEEMRRLSLVASANENGVIFTHPDGKIFWSNEGFSKLTGYSIDEIIGNSPIGLCKGPQSNKETLKQLVSLFQAGKSFNIEVVHYRKDGTTFWGQCTGQPIIGAKGEVIQYFTMIQNITLEKEQEEKLRRREEKYRSIIAGMRLGIMELDMQGKVCFINQCFCDMSGYEPIELIGKPVINLLFTGENKKTVDAELAKRQKGYTNTYEIAIQNKKGEEKWWLITGAPLYNDEGMQVGSISVTLDITEQKTLEHSLREAKSEAEKLAYAKDIFLANMSHEIRTPMNAVLGMSKLLQKTTLTREQRFFSNTIQKAASNLLVIINDILDYSKVESGIISLEIIGFDLKELMNQSIFALTHKAEEKGIVLSSFIDPQINNVLLGDPYRLNQVFMNLLTNAIKFTEEGSVQLKCEVVETTDSTQTLLIQIIDTGIGMDEQFLNNLFEKFKQEDESIARRYGGTGLGMSISKQLIDIMQGDIKVQSRKFEGTTVSLKLSFPIGSENDLPAQEDVIVNAALLRNKRILVAEDNELNRMVLNAVLENYGVQITEAINGIEAIEYLKKGYFDMVLMDVQMPDMDGIKATQLIRENINKRIPIIALTANALKDELEKCLNAGMNAYLSKPFQEEELVHLMTKWINWEPELIPAEEKDSEQPLYDLSQLNAISRGNKEFIKKMLGVFSREVPQTVHAIKDAFIENDFKKIKTLAHRIKPSIDNMCINCLKDDIRRLEVMADASAPGEVETLIRKVDKVIEKVVKQIEVEMV